MHELFANLTLIIHFIFILFVIFGGTLFFISSKAIYFHLPSLVWGIYIQFTNSICPLTYLENWFLSQGGLNTYSSGFINNYIASTIYPENLTSSYQIYLMLFLIIINVIIYSLIIIKVRKI